MQVTFDLADVEKDCVHEDSDDLSTFAEITDRSVCIGFSGYGEQQANNGFGTPVLIENRDGVPHVVIFGDINSEEPTHVISLADAAESLRRE